MKVAIVANWDFVPMHKWRTDNGNSVLTLSGDDVHLWVETEVRNWRLPHPWVSSVGDISKDERAKKARERIENLWEPVDKMIVVAHNLHDELLFAKEHGITPDNTIVVLCCHWSDIVGRYCPRINPLPPNIVRSACWYFGGMKFLRGIHDGILETGKLPQFTNWADDDRMSTKERFGLQDA